MLGIRKQILAFMALVTLIGVLVWQSYDWVRVHAFAPTPFPTLAAAVLAAEVTYVPPADPAQVPSTFTSVPTEVDFSPSTLTPAGVVATAPSATQIPNTATATPDASPSPFVSTVTPTSAPQAIVTLDLTNIDPTFEAIPTPVPTFEVPEDTTNILLIGSDTPIGSGDWRTDTLILVSINRSGPTASMVSLPRDLYIYLPGRFMNRINTAARSGDIDLLRQTILYNFGIPIHYYALIDFSGFVHAVNAMGGVEIAVSCRFEDWRLKSPDLDASDEDNWELFALEPGIYNMDGDLALWYARSRTFSHDFDRGRRQQQLLRAMLNQGVDLNMIPQVPQLWNVLQDSVETDLDIGRILQFATLAAPIRENGVQHLYLAGKTQSWVVPTTGAQVQLPIWEGENMIEGTLQRLFLPPALSKATRPAIYVEIVNASSNPDLARLAAENLAWHGFVPVLGSLEFNPELQGVEQTYLRYFGPNFKGSYDWLISWIFSRPKANIELVTGNSTYAYDYQVILADDYDPCLRELYAPQAFLDQ